MKSTGLILLTLLGLAWMGGPQQASSAEPTWSRDRAFLVPFNVNTQELPRVQEVQLHVSADRGATWQQHSTMRPNEGPKRDTFPFTAPRDGEYWFSARTLDREGRLYPPTLAGIGPGLVVIVDTVAPEVKFHGFNQGGNQLAVEWDLPNDDVDLTSLRVEYRNGGTSGWLPVGIEPRRQGRAEWRPQGNGANEIRLRVFDRAGNEGSRTITISTPGGVPATGGGVPAVVGGVPATGQSGPVPSDTISTYAPSGVDEFRQPSRPDLTRPHSQPATGSGTGAGTGNSPLSNALDPRGGPAAGAPNPYPNQGRPVPWNSGVASQPSQSQPARTQRSPSTTKLVNSTTFNINYDVEEKGKSGLGIVELWWTHDTITWSLYGADEDMTSPFQVQVSGPGVYGFTLVAKSGAGLGSDPPIQGQPPQVWVEVDLDPPSIYLETPRPRTTGDSILDISWRIEDHNPAPKCINLYYAESPSAQWKEIVTNLDNTGSYTWKMPPEVPYKFYVKLEVKDRAGNVGRAETERPVIVDLTRPRLKVLGVEPSNAPPAPLEANRE